MGKVEAGLPEDDPRNPAVIADNVGDNVGDVAGLGADLLESFIESIIASIAILSSLNVVSGAMGGDVLESIKMIPMLIASIGIVASIIGIFYVRIAGSNNPQKALMMGTYLAAFLTIVGTFFLLYGMRGKMESIVFQFTDKVGAFNWLGVFGASIIGVFAGGIIGYVSEYYTSAHYKPVRKLAEIARAVRRSP